MNKLEIFLASSSELLKERNRISACCILLKNSLRNRGIELILNRCEHHLPVLKQNRVQDYFTESLNNSQLVVLLFRDKRGEHTLEELQAARANYECGKQAMEIFFDPTSEDSDMKIFREKTKKEFPDLCHDFTSCNDLSWKFFVMINQKIQQQYNLDLLRVEGTSIYVDNILLYDFKKLNIMPVEIKSLNARIEKKENCENSTQRNNVLLVCHKELDQYRDDFCDTILKLNIILPEEYHINLKLFYNIHNTSFDKILKDTDLLSIIYGRTTGIFGLDKIEQTLDYYKSNNTPTGIVFFKKYKKLYPEIEEIKKRIKDNWQYCSIDDIKFEFTRVYFAISKILFSEHFYFSQNALVSKQTQQPWINIEKLSRESAGKFKVCLEHERDSLINTNNALKMTQIGILDKGIMVLAKPHRPIGVFRGSLDRTYKVRRGDRIGINKHTIDLKSDFHK